MSRLLPFVLDPSRRRPAAVVVVVSFRARSSLFALDPDDAASRPYCARGGRVIACVESFDSSSREDSETMTRADP